MNYTSILDIYHADACLVFMLTGVICGVIRWAHMCRPYDKEWHYFYPARNLVGFFFSAIAMQLPYFLCPADPGAWNFIRIFGIIYYPVCYSALFLRYFRWQRLTGVRDIVFMWLPVALLFAASLSSLFGFDRWLESPVTLYVAAAMGLALAVRHIFVSLWLKRTIDEYHRQNFASESDFPYTFATSVVWLPVIWIVFMWTIFLADSRNVKAAFDLVLTLWMVVFLCQILHPQRMLRPADVEDRLNRIEAEEQKIAAETVDLVKEEAAEAAAIDTAASPEAAVCSDEVKQMVLDIILRRYREQHLTKSDVLSEVDRGKVTAAGNFIASIGYYRLVNMFRLEHARQYAALHPNLKQSEVALVAGFVSGSCYSKAKRSVPFINPDLVKALKISPEE